MWLLRFTIALLACVHLTMPPADSARILAMELVAGKSHWNIMRGVLRALVDGGHVVTVFTPFPDGDRLNYTEVDISDTIVGVRDKNFMDVFAKWRDPLQMIGPLTAKCREVCDKVYANDRMVEVLRQSSGGPRFDLVITEPLLSECVSYVATRLDVPVIYVSPVSTVGMMQRTITGHFPNPAIVSHVMSDHSVPTTFVQRMVNAALAVHLVVTSEFTAYQMRRTNPSPYDSVELTKPSLVFVNGHSVMTAPNPTTESVVNVAGIHLTEPKRLPEDILEFIEQSTSGVIYFSFGSTVKLSSLPDHMKEAFITGLANLPQRILMKYEEELEDMPKNIMTKKWLPQRDILLHPNVKLFISHGGISGLYETIDAGVPILGFPLFGDQARNIDYLVKNGMAISMELMTVTKDSFVQNVLYLLNDKNFTQNAKKSSEIFKDRPMSPAQSVVYWTEYIIRHKGASHLKSHAFNLTWYQYFLLDVISTMLITVFTVLFVTIRILKLGYKYVVRYPKRIKTKSE